MCNAETKLKTRDEREKKRKGKKKEKKAKKLKQKCVNEVDGEKKRRGEGEKMDGNGENR
ncbi:hypothetical protein WN51_06154 [Melipona quadrifasciata]|uniref:Uncharacterized protein n=1 Tax=Melipona quadrifasciata TaxID=166423 RepID=A0A0M8ZP53_9HYME|nr:hypothetical protein WN51_06154 [Melipona quadrifasciata]